MVLCHKLFTFESPDRQKIRRYKTVLVLYLVQWNYGERPHGGEPRGLYHIQLPTKCRQFPRVPQDRRRN